MYKLKSNIMTFIRRYYAEIFLLLLIFIAYFPWLYPSGYLVAGDWTFHYTYLLKGFLSIPKIWESYNNTGGVDVLPSFDAIKILYGAMSYLTTYAVSERILYFWPTLFFSYYGVLKLGKRLFNDDKLALLSFGVLYLFNTFILAAQTSFITYAVVYALAPFVVYVFLNLFEKPTLKKAIQLSLLLLLCTIYEPRGVVALSYLLFILLILCTIFIKFSLKAISLFIGSYFILLILNIYWVLAGLTGAGPSSVTTTQDLFAAYTTVTDALLLHSYAWQGNIFSKFTLVPFRQINSSSYFTIVTFILFYPYLFLKKMALNLQKALIISGLVGIIGIFLLKQQNDPLGYIYQFAFKNIPSFALFRESNKFIVFIIAISITYGFSSSFILSRIKWRSFRYIFIFIVIFVPLINLKPVITHQIGTLFIEKHIPQPYFSINNILEKDPSYYRTLWVPDTTNWSFGTNDHPSLGESSLMDSELPDLYQPEDTTVPDNLIDFLEQSNTHDLINSLDVKYIIVPPIDSPQADNIYRDYGGSRVNFIQALNSITWLKKVNINDSGINVYENNGYRPYISSSVNLNVIPSQSSISNIYTFADNNLNEKEFNFTTNNDLTFPSSSVSDVFTEINQGQIKNGAISAKTFLTSLAGSRYSTNLYSNLNQSILAYTDNNNNFNAYEMGTNGLVYNNDFHTSSPVSKPIAHLSLIPKETYYLNEGEGLYPITNTPYSSLGNATSNLNIFSISKNNLVSNSSLNNGLWSKKVNNCNDAPTTGYLGMDLSNDSPDPSNKSIQFIASDYTACSGPPSINVSQNGSYRLSFNYKATIAQQAGYILIFNNNNKTMVSGRIKASAAWASFDRLVKVPQGATNLKIELLGFPDEELRQLAYTNYENVSLETLNLLDSVNTRKISDFVKSDISPQSTLGYKDPSYDYKNLIPSPNFNDGLWQKQVGDCDNNGTNSKVGMNLDKDSSNGVNYLVLDAITHIACTGPGTIKVKQAQKYLFSFDYQSSNATNAGYNIQFNDPSHTAITKQIPINNSTSQTYSTVLSIPIDANSMSFVVYAYSNSPPGAKIINRYSNFHLTEVPSIQNTYFKVTQQNNPLSSPESIKYKIISPTKKIVYINHATTSFYLNMSEAYSKEWRLEFNNQKIKGLNGWLPTASVDSVSNSDHYELDDYANGWYIDINELCKQKNLCTKNGDGSYNMDMEIEFTAQRYFEVGLIISSLAFIICLGYLISPVNFRLHHHNGWRDENITKN
jgi:hypothetical protein